MKKASVTEDYAEDMGEDEVAKAESEAKPVTPAPPAQEMTYGDQAAASNPIASMASNAISNSSR